VDLERGFFAVNREQSHAVRRNFLRQGLALAATAAAAPGALWSDSVRASKADGVVLRYQDHPKNGKRCAECWAYIAGSNPRDARCKAIEGPISADGWCMAFSPK
jgi:hypothetical protein